jgi:hypothetical protein
MIFGCISSMSVPAQVRMSASVWFLSRSLRGDIEELEGSLCLPDRIVEGKRLFCTCQDEVEGWEIGGET